MTCQFCNPVADEIAAKNNLWYARRNRYLVSEGHLLVIPFRHTPDFFLMTVEENQAVPAVVDLVKRGD